jgi:uncharacterized protein (DUF58 family)
MNYLNPETLARIRALELHARQVVDGYLAGMHRSAQHGFAVEFAQHREYAPGDDTRHIDWKVFGRTERYFLKQYELETNLVCWLLVDASESMRYGSGSVTKYDFACLLAASMAYLVLKQNDSIGLATFDNQLRQSLRASGHPSQLQDVLRILMTGAYTEKSRIGNVFHDATDRFNRRGVVMIFSDLFDEVSELIAGLKHLRHQRHEVVIFQILDPAELEFPFRQATLFRGLEQWPELLTDPLGVRDGYLAEFNTFLENVQRECRMNNIDYLRLRTDQDVGHCLAEYLARRAARYTG